MAKLDAQEKTIWKVAAPTGALSLAKLEKRIKTVQGKASAVDSQMAAKIGE